MTSRGRTIAIALAVTTGIIVVFFLTVWVLMSVLEGGGFPGGQKVAVVEIEGIILQADNVVRELNDHRENPTVRAVVLRVNSPGGVVAPTQEIYSAIQRVRESKKRVVASLGSVAASGGYYVATAADEIYANPGTLTGSIGVIMQMANLEGLFKKVGVDYVVVKAGQYKDIGNVARAMTPEERRMLQALLDDVYNQFVDAVANGRKLDKATVEGFADGRIVSGQQAKQLKMVDALGGLDDAIEEARKLAKMPPKPKLILPRRRFSIFDLLKDHLGLPAGSPLLPGFPAFKTPLYLMD